MEEKDNAASTVTNKFQQLNTAYNYWQDHPDLPHPQDYNPFQLVRSKVDLSDDGKKEPPRLTTDELRDILADVTNVRDRAVITCQLKLGLRGTELCNIKLSEVTIAAAGAGLLLLWLQANKGPSVTGMPTGIVLATCFNPTRVHL